jgi:hypothetical protein
MGFQFTVLWDKHGVSECSCPSSLKLVSITYTSNFSASVHRRMSTPSCPCSSAGKDVLVPAPSNSSAYQGVLIPDPSNSSPYTSSRRTFTMSLPQYSEASSKVPLPSIKATLSTSNFATNVWPFAEALWSAPSIPPALSCSQSPGRRLHVQDVGGTTEKGRYDHQSLTSSAVGRCSLSVCSIFLQRNIIVEYQMILQTEFFKWLIHWNTLSRLQAYDRLPLDCRKRLNLASNL